MEIVDRNAPRGSRSDTHGRDIERVVATEVARLKAEGYSKAYICERSFEIEDRVCQRFE